MKRLASVFLFLILSALAFGGVFHYARFQVQLKKGKDHPSEYVTVYTDLQAGMLEPLNTAFYRESGIRFNIVYLSRSQLLDKNRVEGQAAPDLYITSQDTLLKLKDRHFLSAYSSYQTDTALNLFKDQDGYWTGLWVDPVIFAVNKDYANKHPAFSYTWNEVLTRNSVRISMTDFIAAEMASDLLMCMAEHFGIEDTFILLKNAQDHIVQYGKYLSTPSRMAGMGKCDIGISGLNEAIRSQKENLPIVIMYPTDGAPWYLWGTAVSAESAYPERAQDLMNWLLNSEKYKKIMEENHYYYIYVNDYELKPDQDGNSLVFWDLEKLYFDEGKKDLLAQWGEKIRFGGTNN